ncbi:retron system putative HNH endonuclease [Sutterella sp.]|uniref:retron system putative HNH endonuclease n=1 Tax=Sutterella sp. TaxID=1981025 RepID=UPI0026DFE6B2|nr:retron system putative HNH endonuclease [Sutterella sp.]MDO5532734.1 retron system putative HNH endonuclease [Sutterella sp.]
MRYIQKASKEPWDLAEWKASNAETSQLLTWRSMPGSVKKALRLFLLREQGFLCAYTMERISEENCHIEHFRPRSKYPELQVDYWNLFACWPNPHLPSKDGNKKYTHGAIQKADDDSDICNPIIKKEVEGAFAFAIGGKVRGNTPLAESTIDVLNLNDPGLCAKRQWAIMTSLGISPVNGLPKIQFSKEFIKKRVQKLRTFDERGRLVPFCLAIEQCLLRYQVGNNRL